MVLTVIMTMGMMVEQLRQFNSDGDVDEKNDDNYTDDDDDDAC